MHNITNSTVTFLPHKKKVQWGSFQTALVILLVLFFICYDKEKADRKIFQKHKIAQISGNENNDEINTNTFHI